MVGSIGDGRTREKECWSADVLRREELSGKHDVINRGDKEKRAASAAPVVVRKPEEATVSPPLKARKFERYVDDVPRGGEWTEHLLKIPEGVVREVLGGSDRGYDLPEGTPKEPEIRIGWAKIGTGEMVEEEMLNWIFTVPYPYVLAEEVAVRPQLKKETLEATDVVGFGHESDGRESEAKEFGARSEAGSLGESAEGYRPAKTRWDKTQAKYERRVLNDFRYQMQTSNPERVAFVDMEFMEMSGFCQEGIGAERRMIWDGVFNEQT